MNIETPERIHLEISGLLSKGVSCIDAILDYSARKGIEVETVAEVIKKSVVLKELIREEAIHSNLLKKDTSTNLEKFF